MERRRLRGHLVLILSLILVFPSLAESRPARGLFPNQAQPVLMHFETRPLHADQYTPRDIKPGDLILTQRLKPAAIAILSQEAAVPGPTWGDSDLRVLANTKLYGAYDAAGALQFYCGLGKRASIGAKTLWACFQDKDKDGVFESAGQSQPPLNDPLPTVASVFQLFPVSVQYSDATPQDEWEIAVNFIRVRVIGAIPEFEVVGRRIGDQQWRLVPTFRIVGKVKNPKPDDTFEIAAMQLGSEIGLAHGAKGEALKAKVISAFPARFALPFGELKVITPDLGPAHAAAPNEQTVPSVPTP